MHDWIEEVGRDNALKLAQHLQLIPNTSILFEEPDNYYASLLSGNESRGTKLYELINAMSLIDQIYAIL